MLRYFQRGQRQRAAKTASTLLCGSALAIATVCVPLEPARALPRNQTIRIATPKPVSPMLLLVSIRKQRIRAFDVTGELNSSRISSGQPGFDTPTGVFSILEKKEYHESNIYEGAPMPFMQRLTWSGIALHAGVVPGYRASHGCIRLPASFAKSLFSVTNTGGRVIVTQDEVDPIAFSHPKLFKPLPAETPPAVALPELPEATKVASNDTSVSALSELPQYLGVSAALAEAARDRSAFAPPDRPRSRAEADKVAADKFNRLKDALQSAQTAKTAATDKAKIAVRESDALGPQIAAAKAVLDPLRAAIVNADNKLDQALLAFSNFMANGDAPLTLAKTGGKTKTAPLGNPEDREAELEDAILDLRIEADSARIELARQEMQFASLQGSASRVEAARTAAIENVRQAVTLLRSAQTDVIEANKAVVRGNKTLSVFISLKTERIYIRQGFEPLLEAPITIDNPGRRLGTHVFTAMRYDDRNRDAFDWRLVSAHLPAGVAAEPENGSRKKKSKPRETVLPHTEDNSVDMASDALDAITIPPEILDTITTLVRPGASLIISDKELPANENGLGTEFVVLTR